MSLNSTIRFSPFVVGNSFFANDSKMFLKDMPWELMNELLVLDYDDGWEKLGSEIGLPLSERPRLLYLRQQGRSPTHEIILKWGYQNATIYDLYYVLKKIDRRTEVAYIEKFLKSRNIPLKEANLNNFANESMSCTSLQDNSAVTCESLLQVNPNCLPRPSERNLLQPGANSHLPMQTGQSFFHKPLNTDSPHSNDSVNVNTETNPKYADQKVPKVDLDDSPLAAQPLPSSKNISSLIPYLELGCLFTYKEISCATNGFSETNILGAGAFGTVYYGRLKETEYAIKKLTQDYSEVNTAMTNLKKNSLDELMIQIKFRHPNVVNLYGYSLDSDETCFIYEYMENGSLEDCLACTKDKPPLSWSERLRISQGAACGLQYLHTQSIPVIHGDVKSSNILIDKHKEAKIGDFGLAMFATKGTDTGILTHVSKSMTGSLFGTVAYMPPEFPRSSGKQYLEGDVYSFGVVLHEILTGQKAYDGSRTSRFLMEYIDVMLACPDENLNNDEDISEDLFNRLANILDPAAGPCFEITIKDLYLLANKCTRSKKKERPSMLSVFEELRNINNQLNEIMADLEPKCHSLPYQLQQMYDEHNQRSSSNLRLDVNETNLIPAITNPDQSGYVGEKTDEVEDSSFDESVSNSSDSLMVSCPENLRKKYEEKTLPPSMDLFFENYRKLVESSACVKEDDDEDNEDNS